MSTITFAEIYAGLQITDHSRWPGASLTFSIPSGTSSFWSPVSYPPGDEPSNADYGVLNAAQRTAFINAIGMWERLINFDIIEVPDTPASQGAIRVAFTDVNDYVDADAVAYAYEPPPPGFSAGAFSGDIWLDEYLKDWDPDKGDFFVETLLHELGHTLGLKHPFEDTPLPAEFSNTRYTVMAYDDFADSRFRYFERDGTSLNAHTYIIQPATPMVLDIIAIQGVYGANPALETGNNVYGFESSALYIMTIADGGGNDTFDLSDHVLGSIVNLTPGAFSSIDYFPVADQITGWMALYPTFSASFIRDYLNQPDTYTWSNNVATSLDTVIENVFGASGADTITGNSAANLLIGAGGSDQMFGGLGNDSLSGGSAGSLGNYLRGDEGDDSIAGGANFDDANGNMGNDTVSTGAGDDYCVGGKDNDLLFGDAGVDLVYGNLGDDSCNGGDGNDVVRGGQGNDTLNGGAGDDFVSGDRGDDTMVGGLGADIFHSSSDAGVDRVLDFTLAQGDRVQLDPGTAFTTAQVGADTVIGMSAGQVVLVGVSMSSLLATTIFGF